MIMWLCENIATVVICAILIAVVAAIIISLCLTLSLTVGVIVSAADSENANPKRIMIFGDSVMAGYSYAVGHAMGGYGCGADYNNHTDYLWRHKCRRQHKSARPNFDA